MDFLFWYLPLGLLALLLFLMLRNRAHKLCPWFFAYVAFTFAASIARFVVYRQLRGYYATYWVTEALSCLLGILVMREVFNSVIRARLWWIRLIFPVILVAGITLGLAHAHVLPPKVSGLLLYIVTGEIAVRYVQVLIFVGLGALVAFFGLRWRQYPLGISAGFGLYATVALLFTIKLSDFGIRFTFLWNVAQLVAYSLAVLIWIWFFRIPQEEEPPLDPELAAHYTAILNQYLDWMRRMR